MDWTRTLSGGVSAIRTFRLEQAQHRKRGGLHGDGWVEQVMRRSACLALGIVGRPLLPTPPADPSSAGPTSLSAGPPPPPSAGQALRTLAKPSLASTIF